jgi:hypothetical protein
MFFETPALEALAARLENLLLEDIQVTAPRERIDLNGSPF